ncbi:trypsin-like peptidase domain-containing protein [candidate division KSB1 bacterium]|nr:trypsin-like peptidase domain-containing protein [candidate division KSB1 bacterium]
MKKFLSYFVTLFIGIAIGAIVWTKFKSADSNQFYFEGKTSKYNSTSDSLHSSNIRLINAQQLNSQRRNVITEAVKKVSPAVVGINVFQLQVTRSHGMFDDPFFRHFFPERQELVKGLGSGFIISPDGYVVTNEHVVHNAAKTVVTLPNGDKYDAEKVAFDYISDIALLKINGDQSFPYVYLGNSADLIIGEWAIAVGNPFGLFDMGQPSVSQGIISATDRDFGKQRDNRIYKDMIQTDAAINSGNSGGPLVNSLGEVVGMNTFIFSGSQSSGTSIGLGFAIPINRVKKILKELRTNGSVDRTFKTGISVVNLTRRYARYLGIDIQKGVIVAGVESNSPAARANLQVGDIIVKINDYEVASSDQIDEIFDDLDAKAGDVLKFRIYRQEKYFNVFLRLERIK